MTFALHNRERTDALGCYFEDERLHQAWPQESTPRTLTAFTESAMLMELTIVPFTRGPSISGDIAELVELINHSGLPYRVTPFGTLIEGSWEQLMGIAKTCHTAVRKKTDRVLIMIRLDDYADRTDLLATAVAHVESHLGHSLKQ